MSNLKINSNGDVVALTEVTSRKTQEVVGHNAVAITTTANNDSANIDTSGMTGRKAVLVNNTLNQSVTISVIARTSTQSFGTILGSKSIAAATTGVVSAADIAALIEPWPIIQIRAVCATAPTSGSLSTVLEGVQA